MVNIAPSALSFLKNGCNYSLQHGHIQFYLFVSDEVADIKSVMQSYGEAKEQQQAIGTWLCDYADS